MMPPSKPARPWAVLLNAILLTIPLSGCFDAELKRYPVHGTVSLDGKPIQQATIIFTPRGRGFAAAATIEDGQFSLSELDGPTAGEFDVRINPSEAEFLESGTLKRFHRNRLPAIPKIYQRAGRLTATVAECSPQQLDFQLQSVEK